MSDVDHSPWNPAVVKKLAGTDSTTLAYCYAGQTKAGEWVLPFRYPDESVNVTDIQIALQEFPYVAKRLRYPDVAFAVLNYQSLLVAWATGGDWSVQRG